MQIDGSVALVTGAGPGLGRVYARELVSRGAARVYGPRGILPPSPSPAQLPSRIPSRTSLRVSPRLSQVLVSRA